MLIKFDFISPAKARILTNIVVGLIKTRPSPGTKIKEVCDRFCAYEITPSAIRSDKVILCLHGGAYVSGGGSYCRFAGINIAQHTGCKTIAVDYRLAPENKYPAALEDAHAAYKDLLNRRIKPSDIILFGDSAGGGLCFALCHKLKGDNEPLPAAIIALSPWTDLTSSGESHMTKRKIDPLLLFKDGGPGFHYTGKDNFRNPDVSPLFGNDFSGFPKALIIVGEDEILLSDSLDIARKIHAAGGDVKVQLWRNLYHIFPVFNKILPEARSAMREIAAYIKTLNRFS
jgi:acetyl esterase/lipase